MLEQRRNRIRLIQQRKLADVNIAEMKDLPEQIPLPLVIGTDVTGMSICLFVCPCCPCVGLCAYICISSFTEAAAGRAVHWSDRRR